MFQAFIILKVYTTSNAATRRTLFTKTYINGCTHSHTASATFAEELILMLCQILDNLLEYTLLPF